MKKVPDKDKKKHGASIPDEVHERAKKLAKSMLKLSPEPETPEKDEQGS